jgi:hypothetical protein
VLSQVRQSVQIASTTSIVVALLALIGCAKGTGKVTIEGIAKHKDQPLNWGRLHFHDASGREVGGAQLKKDGSYIATDLVPGTDLKVVVAIAPANETPGSKPPPGTTVIPDENPRPEKVVDVPAKYKKAETTTATIKVPASNQKVDITFD